MTAFTLRLIALISMLLDHVGLTFFPDTTLFHCLGRLSFPIFAFQLTEGYDHTRNRGQYALRLFIFALLSEIPFDWMVFDVPFSLARQNVLWTLLLGLLTLSFTEWIHKTQSEPAIRWIIIFLLLFLMGSIASALNLDYGGFGILQIYAFFRLKDQPHSLQVTCFLVLNLLASGETVRILGLPLPIQGLATLALFPIALYHGDRRQVSDGWARFCYLFYPAHMAVLACLRFLID